MGGYATQEVIGRMKFNPSAVGPSITKEDVDYLAQDPGPEVDEAWWDEMLVAWFEEPEEVKTEESQTHEESAPAQRDSGSTSA